MESRKDLFKGYNVLICGGTSGIGKATAIQFSDLGANVTIVSRDETKLIKIVGKLKHSNTQSHQYIQSNFNYPNEVKNKIKAHLKDGNKYHILINNSGGPKSGPLIDAYEEDFITAFKRHLICNHILFKELYPGMLHYKYGRIINIISTSVKEPIHGLGISNTIRGSVASWAKTLSKEIAQNSITVNNILPGFTETERLNYIIREKSINQKLSFEKTSANMKKNVPLKRFGRPEEIANAIIFLASPYSGYINGVSLAVDGGRLSCI